MTNLFDSFWNEILSRQAPRIKAAYQALSEDEKVRVREHLNKMVREDGWHPEQVLSADTALKVILDE